MFLINHYPKFTPLVCDSLSLQRDPFVLVDVGCSGGIEGHWRAWEPNLIAHGFDPQQNEIARLQKAEKNKNVHYWSYFVGLQDSHPFHEKKKEEDGIWEQFHGTFWKRCSAEYAAQLQTTDVPFQAQPIWENYTKAKISVSEFVRQQQLNSVDFIKIDTDGGDLEALHSCEDMFRPCGVLGVIIESPFGGTDAVTSNSFHNIDRLMRRQGYRLYGLTTQTYSRLDLPLPFVYDILATTKGGQAMWGDAVYFKDAASPYYQEVWDQPLSTAKLIKLAGLYELYGYPDCAAELLNTYKDQLQTEYDLSALLNALTPPFQGKQLSYQEYCELFRTQTESFFPRSYNPQPVPPAPIAPPVRRSLLRRAVGKVWRSLRRAG